MASESEAEIRARVRKASWSGGRTTWDDAHDADVWFWQQATGGERLSAVLALAMEWYVHQQAAASSGLRAR